jgi:hypothetical protein
VIARYGDVEAGFTDPDGDKLLGGTVPPTVDAVIGCYERHWL